MGVLKIATYSSNTRWFTVVTATTIIASISQLYGYEKVSPYFFIAGLVAFLSIAVFMIVRACLFYKETLNELINPEKTLYLFTVVVAVSLVGVCFSRIFHLQTTASVCWYVAIGFWLGISLFSFSILFLHHKSEDREIVNILHGGWFFVTAGTQSVAFLGVIVAEHSITHAIFFQLFSFALWSIGASLYLIFMTLIIMRLVFYRFDSNACLSPYWMNVGAAAITALTGSALYQYINIIGGPFVDFLPFLKGISLFFWSFGLWWLPFLIVLAIRKRTSNSEGFAFTVGYWEVALAIGLYASGTIQLVGLFKGQYLVILSMCFYFAFIVLWCFSSIFTIVHLVRSSIWMPVNDLTINYAVPYSFKLRGKVFKVKEVINEWLDQTIEGVLKKRYSVVINDNLACQISYDMLTKKWYFDKIENNFRL